MLVCAHREFQGEGYGVAPTNKADRCRVEVQDVEVGLVLGLTGTTS